MSDFEPNEYHLRFLFKNSFFLGPDILDRLFSLLDTLDLFDRQRMLWGWVYGAIGSSRSDEMDMEEEAVEAAYSAFKEKCRELNRQGVTDYFLVQSVVSFALVNLFESAKGWLDERLSEADKAMLYHSRLRLTEINPKYGEEFLSRVEEQLTNRAADTRLARERYQMFCDRVVKELLELPPDLREVIDSAMGE